MNIKHTFQPGRLDPRHHGWTDLFGDQIPPPAEHILQPGETEAEQLVVAGRYLLSLVLADPKAIEEVMRIEVGAKAIDIIADHKGELLIGTGLALASPGIGGKKGIQFGPEVIVEIIIEQFLIAFPLFEGVGALLLMAKAIGVMGHEIVRFERLSRSELLHSAFKGIGPAGRRTVCIHTATFVGQKGTGRGRGVAQLELQPGKKGVTPLTELGVLMKKITGMQAQVVFQANEVIGKQEHIDITTAGEKTPDPGVAVEIET